MRTLSDALKEMYGEKVYKLSLSSGCTCPNRDGTVGTGGCTFCSAGGSGEYASSFTDLPTQIKQAKARISKKTDAKKFIAYFQSFTNTYGNIGRLRSLYLETIRQPEIVILSIGTRPDCLGNDVMEMLRELNAIKPVWIELGLQTIHAKTAERIHRGYALPVFEEAVRKLKEAGITVIVHIIAGLPGETREDMLDTVSYLAEMDPGIDGIKIQMLNILRGSQLADEYMQDPFPLLSLEEYASLTAEMIRILPDRIVIHRMSGDGPGNLLIAPDWVRNKKKVLNTIHRCLRESGSKV